MSPSKVVVHIVKSLYSMKGMTLKELLWEFRKKPMKTRLRGKDKTRKKETKRRELITKINLTIYKQRNQGVI